MAPQGNEINPEGGPSWKTFWPSTQQVSVIKRELSWMKKKIFLRYNNQKYDPGLDISLDKLAAEGISGSTGNLKYDLGIRRSNF